MSQHNTGSQKERRDICKFQWGLLYPYTQLRAGSAKLLIVFNVGYSAVYVLKAAHFASTSFSHNLFICGLVFFFR